MGTGTRGLFHALTFLFHTFPKSDFWCSPT